MPFSTLFIRFPLPTFLLPLLYSILGCVLPLQEVALRQSLPSFSVLCYPRPYRSLLPHNVISPTDVFVFRLILHPLSATVLLTVHLLSFIRAMCPAHFHFVLVTSTSEMLQKRFLEGAWKTFSNSFVWSYICAFLTLNPSCGFVLFPGRQFQLYSQGARVTYRAPSLPPPPPPPPRNLPRRFQNVP